MAYRVVNETRGKVLGTQVGLADRFWSRLRGLIGKKELEPGEGLILVPCRGVHMYGMTYPIDVAFADREGEIVALYRELAPGARTKMHTGARSAVELPPGTLAETGTMIGDRLAWRPEAGE
ncbi:MAG TPA: DUF192 domain-containing protein [Gemmatimonadota bacterium]|nr:DUF192 domain-containing protein [Gemmatimonadota bacterium]